MRLTIEVLGLADGVALVPVFPPGLAELTAVVELAYPGLGVEVVPAGGKGEQLGLQ